MVQRRAARFVCGDFRFDSSVTAMIGSLGWNALKERRSAYRSKLFERLVSSEFSNVLEDVVIPLNSERDLREASKKRYKELITRTDSYFWSFFPLSIREANMAN